MDTRHILKRLLWREGRENWLFLLAGLLLSGLARTSLDLIGLMLLALLVSLWAISHGSAARRRSSFDFRHLPLAPRLDGAVSFLLPAAIAALIGAGMGYWWLYGYTGNTWVIWLCLTCMVANFSSCYLLSAASTLLPAVLLAAAWVVYTAMMYFMVFKYFAYLKDVSCHDNIPPDYLVLAIIHSYPIIALGALGGMCVLIALTHRTPILIVRVPAILLLCALPLGWFVKELRMPRKPVDDILVTMLRDETLRLSLHYHAQSTSLEFTDHRADYHTMRDFAGRIVPCARDSRGDVLLLQQFPREARVRLLCWTPRTGRLRADTGIQAGSGALQGNVYQLADCGSLSPDNRYLLLLLKSRLDSGSDLWLVDRRQGQARLLRPESGYALAENVRWYGKQAIYIDDKNDMLCVNLDAQRADPMSWPIPREVH